MTKIYAHPLNPPNKYDTSEYADARHDGYWWALSEKSAPSDYPLIEYSGMMLTNLKEVNEAIKKLGSMGYELAGPKPVKHWDRNPDWQKYKKKHYP